MGGCSVAHLPSGFGQKLTLLSELTITQNGLDSLEQLAGTTELESLLCCSPCLNLPCFPQHVVLIWANFSPNLLDMNSISSLPPACCRSWTKLKDLNLTSNSLRTLPNEISLMHSLEVLDVSSNLLVRLPETLSACSKLRRLSAAKNQIIEFPRIYTSLPELKELDLSNNVITYIFNHNTPEQARVVTWAELEDLNLSRNKLRDLPLSVLRLADRAFGKLTRLQLEHNRLRTFPTLPSPSALSQLDLFTFKLNRFVQLPQALQDLSRSSVAAFKETIPDEYAFQSPVTSAANHFSLPCLGLSLAFTLDPSVAPATTGACMPWGSPTS